MANTANMPSTPVLDSSDRGEMARDRPCSTLAGAREAAVARHRHPLRRMLGVLGPGLISGASNDDPSAVGTYAVAGASLGFATLWTALATFPLMTALQFIAAKIGLVTGMGLAGVLRRHYPKLLVYPVVFALVAANTINAGADLGAMAAAINMFAPVPIAALVLPIALVMLGLQLGGSYRLITNAFKWLTLTLLAYIVASAFIRPQLLEVVRGTFVPRIHFEPAFLSVLLAVLGTTFSPYLWFWQSSQEVEGGGAGIAPHSPRRPGTSDGELRLAGWDILIGMLFSSVIMYFIILTTGATLFVGGKTHIQSAVDAATALRPLAGDLAPVLLALGLIGSGFLAVPVLTACSAYVLAEAFGWNYGLDQKPARAKEFYAIIAGAMIVGVSIDLVGINPIDALVWTSIVFGVLDPPLLVIIMHIANNRAIMGARVNGWALNVLGWATTVLMWTVAAGAILTWSK